MPWKTFLRPRSAPATPPAGAAPGRRSRRGLLVVAAAIVVAGLLLRSVPGITGDVAGGILYAGLLFVLVAVLMPSAPAARIGGISFGLCVVVELLQLTGLPTIVAGLVPPLRYILGATFVASDFLAYAGGTLCAVVIDRLVRSKVRRAAGGAHPVQ